MSVGLLTFYIGGSELVYFLSSCLISYRVSKSKVFFFLDLALRESQIIFKGSFEILRCGYFDY